MIIVAVDPGVKGALTIINTYAYRNVISFPFAHNTMSDIHGFLSEIRGGEVYSRAKHIEKYSTLKTVSSPSSQVLAPEHAEDNTMELWLENPGQIVPKKDTKIGGLLAGMSASRKLGRSVGFWEGIAVSLSIPTILVSPKSWQDRLSCRSGGNKNITKNTAISCFPFLTDRNGKSTITHDIADSLLIAVYAYLEYAEPKYIPQVFKNQISPTKGIPTLKGNTNALPRTSSRPKRPTRRNSST